MRRLCYVTMVLAAWRCFAAEETPVAKPWEGRSTLLATVLFPVNLPCNIAANVLGMTAGACMIPVNFPNEFGWVIAAVPLAPIAGVFAGISDTIDKRFFWEASMRLEYETEADPAQYQQ